MKKQLVLAATFAVGIIANTAASAECTSIQDDMIVDSAGAIVTVGYDGWGYNYQAQMFNGGYCDAYRGAAWCQPYADVDLMMKWNTGWMSNKDCDGDYALDRHPGYDSYIGSGAWLTNHQSGKVEVKGKMRKWTYFVKIVAAPEDAVVVGDNWVAADGVVIGPVIWGQFAVIQEVSNDPSNGDHGILYKSPAGPGLGDLQ